MGAALIFGRVLTIIISKTFPFETAYFAERNKRSTRPAFRSVLLRIHPHGPSKTSYFTTVKSHTMGIRMPLERNAGFILHSMSPTCGSWMERSTTTPKTGSADHTEANAQAPDIILGEIRSTRI